MKRKEEGQITFVTVKKLLKETMHHFVEKDFLEIGKHWVVASGMSGVKRTFASLPKRWDCDLFTATRKECYAFTLGGLVFKVFKPTFKKKILPRRIGS